MSSVQPAPVILAPSVTVQEAIARLHETQTTAAVVVDHQRFVGVFAAPDLIRTIAHGLSLAETTIATVMSTPTAILSEFESEFAQDAVVELLQHHSLPWIPVVNASGQFVRVITRAEAFAAQLPDLPTYSPASIEIQPDLHPSDFAPLAILSRSALQRALHRAEQTNQLLWEVFPNLLIRMRRDGTYLDFVPAKAFKSFTPAPHIQGKTVFEVMPLGFACERMYYVELALKTQQTQAYEYELEFEGERRYQEAQITASSDDEVLIIVRDITEQKRIEEELRESQRFIQSIADSSPNLLYLYDICDHRNVYINRRIEQLLGYTSDEIQKIRHNLLQDLLHPDDRAIYEQKLQHYATMDDGEIMEFEYRIRQKNGEWRWLRSLDTVFERTPEGKPKLILGTAIDITDRKQAAEAIERSEKKYRDLVELAGSIILRFDTSGRITFLNEYGQQFFGYSEAEILNRDIVGTLVPETESTGRNLRELIVKLCRDPSDHNLSENENILSNGERVWVQWSDKPIYNDRGELVEVLSVGVDITERKRVQEQLAIAKEAAEAASRAKSDFLSMMSHELRTPLTSILGFAEVIARKSSLSTEHQDYLTLIRQSGTHLLNLINSVLEMSRIEAGGLRCHPRRFNVHQLFQTMEALFQLRAADKGLELMIDWEIDLPLFICADEDKLRQILINLLDNALKFTHRGRVMLRASWSPGRLNAAPALLQIEVEDTGIGIASSEMGLLFNAFVQTEAGRSMHRGTGLGLAISHQFVQAMGGCITVQSWEGQGSCFTVMIPFHIEPDPPQRHSGSPHQNPQSQPDGFSSALVSTSPPSPKSVLADSSALPISLESLDSPQTLPVEWVTHLHQAALRLSSNQCLALIEQLPSTHTTLAQTLTQWVNRFQFEDIILWINGR